MDMAVTRTGECAIEEPKFKSLEKETAWLIVLVVVDKVDSISDPASADPRQAAIYNEQCGDSLHFSRL